jgi:penicillin-binding protein 2B
MKNSLNYLNIQPSKLEVAEINKLPKLVGEPVGDTVKSLQADGYEPIVLGNGQKVTGQLPKAGTTILEGEKVIIRTNGDLKAPDMTGWSLRDVMKVANIANLKLSSKGKGYVTNQNLKPKEPLKSGDYLIVDLKTPEEQLTNSGSSKQNDGTVKD